MSDGNARGRSFHDGKQDTAPGAVNHGYNFQEQWKRALELDPPFVMVTGWNEWIAGRWGKPGGPLVFVDQFDQEYSRDIEPMQGGARRQLLLAAGGQRPPLQGRAAAARGLGAQVDSHRRRLRAVARRRARSSPDHVGETTPRDFDGAGRLHYTNRTRPQRPGRARRSPATTQNVYFYARTREPLTPRTDPNWMWLLIDADQNADDRLGGLRLHRQPHHRDATARPGWKRTTAAGNGGKVAQVTMPVRGQRTAPGHPALGPGPAREEAGPVARLQVGRQPPAPRRHHGLLPQRRRRARGPVHVSLRGGGVRARRRAWFQEGSSVRGFRGVCVRPFVAYATKGCRLLAGGRFEAAVSFAEGDRVLCGKTMLWLDPLRRPLRESHDMDSGAYLPRSPGRYSRSPIRSRMTSKCPSME